jgi:hypothetical protein
MNIIVFAHMVPRNDVCSEANADKISIGEYDKCFGRLGRGPGLTLQAKRSAVTYSSDYTSVHSNVNSLIPLCVVMSPSGWRDQLRIGE